MVIIVGAYKSRADAEHGASELHLAGIESENVNILTPDFGGTEEEHSVPTIAGEQPGIVKTIGAVAGGAAGFGLGGGLVSLLVPGVGPVLAIGLAGGAVLGALAGGTAGAAAERTIFSGLPEEEMFIYKNALRQGRTIVIVSVDEQREADVARGIFTETGAESIDQARKQWWVGLRDVEKERYEGGANPPREVASDERRRKIAGGHTK